MKTVLTITGSDSTGVSGVQADIRVIASLGAYAVSAITSVTVQNTIGIQGFYDLPASTVRGQVEAIVNDVEPEVVKIGMIRRTDVLQVIVDMLVKYKPRFVVYDPILRSANGDLLVSPDVVAQIRQQLLPLCSFIVVRRNEMHDIIGEAVMPTVHVIDEAMLHGQQSAFSSAVAAFVAMGDSEQDAERKAHDFIAKEAQPRKRPQSVGEQLYNRFLTCVEEHFHTNSDVAFYADCLNVTPTYLAQVCHRVSGLSPKNIIDRQVTKSICDKLLSSGKTVQEIAYDHGFSSQAHFSKFFKKQTGLSPSDFRRQANKQTQNHETE